MTDLMCALAPLVCAYAAIVLAFTTWLHLVNGVRLLATYPRGARLYLVRGAWYGLGCVVACAVFEAFIHS